MDVFQRIIRVGTVTDHGLLPAVLHAPDSFIHSFLFAPFILVEIPLVSP